MATLAEREFANYDELRDAVIKMVLDQRDQFALNQGGHQLYFIKDNLCQRTADAASEIENEKLVRIVAGSPEMLYWRLNQNSTPLDLRKAIRECIRSKLYDDLQNAWRNTPLPGQEPSP